jgi:ParB family chromosome partitioning protein
LTTITDTAITPATNQDDAAAGLPDPGAAPGAKGQQDSWPSFTDRPMIPVALLTAHPGNVREDKHADPAFCQSVAAAGIITPLEITISPDHDGYVVVDGNIRLDAAIKAGLDAVPYVFSPGTADDAGQQYLHMLISSRFRRDLSVPEKAAALFSASQAGMSKAEIRRATGLKAAEIRAGITAGGLSAETRKLIESGCYEWTLEDLALIAPFEGDPNTMNRIVEALGYGQPLNYIVQKLHDEREAHARRSELIADLEAKGVTVLDHAPDGATSLYGLCAGPAPGPDDGPDPDSGQPDATAADSHGSDTDDGQADEDGAKEMDPAAHASCPGAVAVLRPWQQEPSWYCLDPDKYGHPRKHQPVLPLARGGSDPGTGSPDDSTEPDPGRKLVISGNKAWDAAAKVRHRWLAAFLSRKAPPAGSGTFVAQFVTTQIITMPPPLCQALGGIRNTGTYERISGPAPGDASAAAQPRLWMLALAPIAAAYEDQMTATTVSRSTWRTDRHSSCPRADAGIWLSFLARAGYPLSPIERAVADGVPYQGDAVHSELIAAAAGDVAEAQDNSEPGENQSLAPEDAFAGDDGQDAVQPLAA